MFTFTKSSTDYLIAKCLKYLRFLSSVPHSLSTAVPPCLIALVPIFLTSCSPTLTPTEYLNYFERNRSKMTKTIERNNVKALVAHIPPEYYAAMAMEDDTTLVADSVLKRYDNSIFFVLSIKAAADSVTMSPLLSQAGVGGFKENVERNTFGREEDVFLLYGKDTVKTMSIRYERNWGVGNDDSFLLGFSKKSLKEQLTKYHLIIREMTPALGTIDIKVSELLKTTKRLKG